MANLRVNAFDRMIAQHDIEIGLSADAQEFVGFPRQAGEFWPHPCQYDAWLAHDSGPSQGVWPAVRLVEAGKNTEPDKHSSRPTFMIGKIGATFHESV